MSIKRCKIYTLKNEGKSFSLSAYSRRFSWDEEKIKELLMKISNAFEEGRELFLGSVLLYEENGEYKILDGGHRIALVGALLQSLDGAKQFDEIIQEVREVIEDFTHSNPKAFARFLRSNIFFALTELSSQSNFADILLKSQTMRKPLQKTDILKARLLSKSTQESVNAKLWEECEKQCKVIDFSYFLLSTLALFKPDTSIEIEKSKMLEIFENNLKDEIEKFFEKMREIKGIFESYIPTKEEDKWKLEGKSKEYIKLLSYLLTARNHKTWLREFIAFVIEKNPSDEECIAYLEGLDNALALARYQKELKEYVKSTKGRDKGNVCGASKEWGFLNQGEGTSHYWFYRLEYYLFKDRKRFESIKLDGKSFVEVAEGYEFAKLNSIEHIQPQSRAKEGDWSKQDKDIFGNLALISKSFNSSLNAKNVKKKKKQIIQQVKEGKTQSLKMILAYAEIEEVWSLQMAKQHQEKMIKILQVSLSSS